MSTRDVVILGGGIAGIAAAVRLAENGIKPLLVERRPFLGGRAFSFVDRTSREEIDNGQHVILGVCHRFLRLLETLGTRDQLALGPVLDVPISMEGKVAKLRANRILGNGTALLGYGHLKLADRISVASLLMKIKMRLAGSGDEDNLMGMSFASWLSSRGQSAEAIDRFWALFILPVFNCHINEVTAIDAIRFTRIALLGSTSDAAIGYPKIGLSSLIGHPATSYLQEQGVAVATNVRVNSININRSGRFEIEFSNRDSERTGNVISALTPNALEQILPPSNERFADMKSTLVGTEYSPIVAVHLWYLEPVMTEPVKAFIDLGLQWVFNDSAIRGNSGDGSQHIVVSLSGAEDWEPLKKIEVLDRVTAAMSEAFPKARENTVINSAVVKTLDATIKIGPGSDKRRLATKTSLPGFFLAGDWTDTSLPATMEGAIQSGERAADLVWQHLSKHGG